MHNARFLFDMLSSPADRHSALDDAQGIVAGALVAALGIAVMSAGGLITGGMAGLAFVLHYLTGLSFGLLFFLLNLPFYLLSLKRLGLAFTLKTFLAVGLVSIAADLQPRLLGIGLHEPLYGGIIGGLLLSFGLLALYRHRASLGGIGILSVWLQDRFGWRAGLIQLAFDLAILVVALFIAPPATVLASIAGALVLNLFIAINHRRDRYIAI